jgi:sulfate/thiosulfate-binding protein
VNLRRPIRSVLAATTIALLALTGCGSDSEETSSTPANGEAGDGPALPAAELALVAYSTPQEAYEKIIAAFRKTTQGRKITFSQSYGASGDQSRAVESGLPADVVAFSLEPDVTRLVKAGIVAADWNSDQFKGMVTDSVVVIGTRKGNPENIKGWSDLTRPNVEVITPNPFTSGGARWNVMAAYGAASDVGKDDAAGVAYLGNLFANVPVQDDTARKSLQTFTGGKGDAIIAYENEAVFAQDKGAPLDYVVPDQTILIENPVAVTANSRHPEAARAFVAFLRSETAQRIFADAGYRPVVEGVAEPAEFKAPAKLFTIADLGGWTAVTDRFFSPQGSVMADVERKLGVSTARS